MSDLTTEHIQIDRDYIEKQGPVFLAALDKFLADQASDIAGLQLFNLRTMAQSLKRSYEQMDAMLELLEQRKGNQA